MGTQTQCKKQQTPSGYDEYPQYNSPYDPIIFIRSPSRVILIKVITNLCRQSRGKNNLKNFLNNEFMTTQNIAISGKGENGDYSISLTHMYQKGQVPNTKLNSTTVNSSGSLKVVISLNWNQHYLITNSILPTIRKQVTVQIIFFIIYYYGWARMSISSILETIGSQVAAGTRFRKFYSIWCKECSTIQL